MKRTSCRATGGQLVPDWLPHSGRLQDLCLGVFLSRVARS
jgi:hypothetical protein